MSLIECVPNVSEGRRRGCRRGDGRGDPSRSRRTAARPFLRRVAQPLGVHPGRRRGRPRERRPGAVRARGRATSTCARTAASTRASARSTSCRSSRSRARRWPTASRWRGRSAADGRGTLRHPGLSVRRRAARPGAPATSKTSGAASSKGWPRRWRQEGWAPDFGRRDAAPDRRRHGRSARACRSSPTTSISPPTGSTSRRKIAAAIRFSTRRLPVREGDGRRAARTAASSRSR